MAETAMTPEEITKLIQTLMPLIATFASMAANWYSRTGHPAAPHAAVIATAAHNVIQADQAHQFAQAAAKPVDPQTPS